MKFDIVRESGYEGFDVGGNQGVGKMRTLKEKINRVTGNKIQNQKKNGTETPKNPVFFFSSYVPLYFGLMTNLSVFFFFFEIGGDTGST